MSLSADEFEGAVRLKTINQIEPWLGVEEQAAVAEYLASGGWLTEFRKTREFEQLLASRTGARYASVMMNGTVTLCAALMALGIGQDDEVLVPDFTMIACANAVRLAGAKPVLVDIEPDTLCMDLNRASDALSRRTKVIMFVSLNGRASNMTHVVEFAKSHGLFLIEDAAQALGSNWNGRQVGTFGEFGSFSFSSPKVITTGQGGALVTDSEELYERTRRIKDFGRAKAGIDYHETMGFNFKFTDLQAVIGIEQMKKLDWRLERKRQMFELYRHGLADTPQVKFITTNGETRLWFIDILAENREGLMTWLKAHGIGTRPFYPPIHSQPPYREEGSFTVSDSIAQAGVWLPSSSFLSDSDIALVCDSVHQFYQQ